MIAHKSAGSGFKEKTSSLPTSYLSYLGFSSFFPFQNIATNQIRSKDGRFNFSAMRIHLRHLSSSIQKRNKKWQRAKISQNTTKLRVQVGYFDTNWPTIESNRLSRGIRWKIKVAHLKIIFEQLSGNVFPCQWVTH